MDEDGDALTCDKRRSLRVLGETGPLPSVQAQVEAQRIVISAARQGRAEHQARADAAMQLRVGAILRARGITQAEAFDFAMNEGLEGILKEYGR